MTDSRHISPFAPYTRAAIVTLLTRVGQLTDRELRHDLTRPELADLDEITTNALTVAEGFTAQHPDESPIAGDDVMVLIAARSAVLKRLAASRKQQRRRR